MNIWFELQEGMVNPRSQDEIGWRTVEVFESKDTAVKEARKWKIRLWRVVECKAVSYSSGAQILMRAEKGAA